MIPEPIPAIELVEQAEANYALVDADQEQPTRPMDLYEAMARALKYNLGYRVEELQTSVRAAQLELAQHNMLPNAITNAGYVSRDNYHASSSLNLETNTPNFGASTSVDKRFQTADLQFSWNILDFGLSYVRARQAADKVLIAEELQRKVLHNLLEDVRNAFWRAASYQRLISRLRQLEERVRVALRNSRLLSENRQTIRLTALNFERELVKIKRTIKTLQRDIVLSKARLAGLMNLKPGTQFTLNTSKRARAPRSLPMGLDRMMMVALSNRSELRENLYQQRINHQEARAALLELLPGIQIFAGPNWDSNSFLLNTDWLSWGTKASWNLIKVFKYPAKSAVIGFQDEVLKARAMALAMTVMTQVHVSRIRFHHFIQEFAAAQEYRSVQNRLVRQIRVENEANRISEQTLLREEMNTLIVDAKYDIAFARLQSAYANVFASIGGVPFAGINPTSSIDEIATALRGDWLERNYLGTKDYINNDVVQLDFDGKNEEVAG